MYERVNALSMAVYVCANERRTRWFETTEL